MFFVMNDNNTEKQYWQYISDAKIALQKAKIIAEENNCISAICNIKIALNALATTKYFEKCVDIF